MSTLNDNSNSKISTNTLIDYHVESYYISPCKRLISKFPTVSNILKN